MPTTFDRIEGTRYQDGKGGASSRASGSYLTIPFWEQYDGSGCGGAIDSFSVSSSARINYLADEDLCRFDEYLTDSFKMSGSNEMAGDEAEAAWGLLVAYMDAAKTAAGSTGTSGIHAEALAAFTTAYPKSRLGRDGLVDPRSGSVLRYVEMGLGKDRCGGDIQMLNGSISINLVNSECTFAGRIDISYMLRYRPADVTQAVSAIATELKRDAIASSSAYLSAPTFNTARAIIGAAPPLVVALPA